MSDRPTVTGGAGAAPLPPFRPRRAAPDRLWQVALGTHTLGGPWPAALPQEPQAQRAAWHRLAAWAARHGFDGIDLGAWACDFYTAPLETLRGVQEAIQSAGPTLVSFNCLRKCVTHPAVAAQNRRDLHRAVEVACALRVPFVSISLALDADVVGVPQADVRGTRLSPGAGRDAADAEFADAAAFLAELADLAAPHAVEIVLELHHCSLADTAGRLLRLLALAARPNLSANPDLGNVTWGYEVPEEDWRESARALAGRVNFWHVKNLQRVHIPEAQRAAYVHAPLGLGDIDYRWALGRLVAHGFRGWLSLEAAGPGDWLSFAAAGKAYLDEVHAELAAEWLAAPHPTPSGEEPA